MEIAEVGGSLIGVLEFVIVVVVLLWVLSWFLGRFRP